MEREASETHSRLIAWAKELGRNDCGTLLQQNLDEQKSGDKKLTAWPRTRSIARPAEPP
jgi:ferritin-like metal-binding protein YciE